MHERSEIIWSPGSYNGTIDDNGLIDECCTCSAGGGMRIPRALCRFPFKCSEGCQEPALIRSSLMATKLVARRPAMTGAPPGTGLALHSIHGPWQMAATGLPLATMAHTTFRARYSKLEVRRNIILMHRGPRAFENFGAYNQEQIHLMMRRGS